MLIANEQTLDAIEELRSVVPYKMPDGVGCWYEMGKWINISEIKNWVEKIEAIWKEHWSEMKDYTRIKRNRIQCKRCGDIIESVHRHDFRWCSCQSCAVDGGKEYLRRYAVSPDDVIELTEYEDMEETDGKK